MRKIIFLTVISIFISFCSLSAENTPKDGVYEGKSGFVRVSVTIKGGEISAIEILQHGGGGPKYAEMIRPLIDKIINKQSTDVDAVTGATVSSKYLKEAVDNALYKAR